MNGDDVVNGLDAGVLSANWLDYPNGGATLADGDMNGDGKVDGLDANIISVNWLAELPAAVVEPPTESSVAAEAATDEALLDLIAANFLRFRIGGATRADGNVNGDGYVDGLDVNWLAM